MTNSLLVFEKLGGEPSRFLIEIGKVYRIGRDPDNDVVISDPHVSSYHAVLSFDATQEAFILRDLVSSNGTKVSGQRIFGAVRWQDGHTVAFGMIEATLVTSPAEIQKLKPKFKRVNGDRQAPKRIPLKKAESSALQDKISERDKEIETSKQLVSATVRTQHQRLRSEEGSIALRKAFVISCCLCYHLIQGGIKGSLKTN